MPGNPPLDLTPDEFRRAASVLADFLAEYLGAIRERKVSTVPDPMALRRAFDEPFPRHGQGFEALLAALRSRILPNTMTIGSPRYFGLFNPSAIPVATLCDLIVSTLNQNQGAFLQSPAMTAIEDRVIRWLLALVGFPENGYGHFTNGGTAANLTALKLARDRAAPGVGERGAMVLAGRGRVYASDQCHFSIERCVDVLGLGRSALVRIESDANHRLKPDLLAQRLNTDRAEGLLPVAIVATAGTTPSASIDPLEAIADIAGEAQVFLHVDAAYGGSAILSDRLRPRLKGMARADSITIDPHKWMFIPFESGCVLVRDRRQLIASFGEQPAYLKDSADRFAVLPDFYREGLQGSRRARAFTVWATLQVHGADAFARAIERQADLTLYLRDRVRAMPDFEICHEPDLGLLCFRLAPAGMTPQQQDELNRQIQRQVEASGIAWFATTLLKGRIVLRLNIESFRTTEDDIDRTLAAIADAVAEVATAKPPQAKPNPKIEAR
jgi:aromatic-L-amino-acid decarboxylase